MFFETDRLLREEVQEAVMPTEQFTCSKCKRLVEFTADTGQVKVVTCRHCGTKVQVVIEAKKKVA
jgi:DNA-directed RNA polymerase subunit RPC12/RpoP